VIAPGLMVNLDGVSSHYAKQTEPDAVTFQQHVAPDHFRAG
jgi:hypothetical protein